MKLAQNRILSQKNRISLRELCEEEMTNRQALGYLLLACKQLGMTKEEATKICQEMEYLFDALTEEEAEEQGWGWYRAM
ncbi:hypothetical protein [Geobacillus subterraneus]|uniref:Uncharacterized protein n=1 Tax=Geobacillus subterraneus TaxID=129338 RepID=A0A679FV64_9BACL|nr:hypothetical protein [Geobacillus subterraneus]BBW98879.1 hypothetical protein GsuE55_37120 [Geobacillus subterraneus]